MQLLSETPDDTDLTESARAVRQQAELVVGVGVRCELDASLRNAPLLRRRDQRLTESTTPACGLYIPAFEEGHPIGTAAFGVWANRELRETGKLAAIILGDQNRSRLTSSAD